VQAGDRNDQHGPGLDDHRRGEQPLPGQQIQFSDEFRRPPGRQPPFGPGLVIHDRHLAGQDHDEVVGAVALPEQHLARNRRPHLTLPAQQVDLLAGQPHIRYDRGG
jgi:hypothetical protein